MITVAIPVGPFPANKQWLDECIQSVVNQTRPADEILIIDDMAGLSTQDYPKARLWYSPWLLGVAHAFNFGVALAKNECVLMLGSDDVLKPDCLETCEKEYISQGKRDGYYYCGVEYMDDRPDKTQTVPCNMAMVTKGLWKKTGGFPVESSSGANDAVLVSIMLNFMHEYLIPIDGGRAIAYYRPHAGTDTARRGVWQGVILETRDILARTWKEPRWGRY
jgi:glycosyltransferase involved in cell wall biosynthesis